MKYPKCLVNHPMNYSENFIAIWWGNSGKLFRHKFFTQEYWALIEGVNGIAKPYYLSYAKDDDDAVIYIQHMLGIF